MSCIRPSVTEDQCIDLDKIFSSDVIIKAIFSFHPSKAPGHDGIHAIFFQKYWDIIGENIIGTCLNFLNNGSTFGEINHTLLVLIPKCKNPHTPASIRAISLCNMLYKIISKVLANRLKKILD